MSTPEHDFDLFEDYWDDDVSTTAIDDQVNNTDGGEEQSDDDVSQSHSDHQSTSQRRSTRVVGKPVKTYVYEHQFSESDSEHNYEPSDGEEVDSEEETEVEDEEMDEPGPSTSKAKKRVAPKRKRTIKDEENEPKRRANESKIVQTLKLKCSQCSLHLDPIELSDHQMTEHGLAKHRCLVRGCGFTTNK